MSAALIEPSWPTGPRTVPVGSTTYYLPTGSGVATGPSGLVYFLIRARVYCATERGEIRIPERIRGTLASFYFGGRRAP